MSGGDNIKIGFIGAGKVGFSLGKYFSENNLNIVGYYSRSLESAKEAAEFTKSNYFSSIQEIVIKSDAIIITTPDGVIEDIWNSIKELSIENKIICHCSGSLSSRIFSNIEDHNAYGYSIHPMFAISNKYNSHKQLKEAFITIEGPNKYIKDIKNMIEGLGNKTQVISWKNKSEYHAASVFVSNHVIALAETGSSLLKKCGFSDEEALSALKPLMINNIQNIVEKGTINSLTGPIERGDINTIKRHLESLSEDDRELYRLLSKKLISIGKVKNINRDYSKLEKMMGE
ncbi:Rossmann-like and DUF2520 domain-containing protein [Clostridium paraputrificum]|uniref:Rossmann-like and DUF2520 domain-containing protein n=1 Tax=Clostridium paraputrificum TaxID=29363 RepID=UPI003D34F7F5